MNDGGWVIATHGLSKTYKQVHALKDLNLQVPEHSIFGFLGPNGAGKTTTIKLLLGLIYPTAGSASVLGLDAVRDSVAIPAICRRNRSLIRKKPCAKKSNPAWAM